MAAARDRPSPLITPRAWRLWEDYDIPLGLPEVISLLTSLPPDQRVETRFLRPPAVFHRLVGTVGGQRFALVGVKEGGERWIVIRSVVPLGPEED